MSFALKCLVIILITFTNLACPLPHDPEKSFDQAKRRGLRVGVVGDVSHQAISTGTLTKLKQFAKAHELDLIPIRDSLDALLHQLEKFKIDLVAEPLNQNSPW